jgi:hypothetical protein
VHHLKQGNYSAWFREIIKDRELADDAVTIETGDRLDAQKSRQRIGDAVIRRYTAPVTHEP